MTATIRFELNGQAVAVPAEGSLLDALREHLGVRSAKDGCSPQGQCGCCTVWIDGHPRVACVTPVGRVVDRRVTTLEGLADAPRWTALMSEAGASQCGFCTPGIIMRCAALAPERRTDPAAVRHALLAHVCRCTGWNTIVEAVAQVDDPSVTTPGVGWSRHPGAAAEQAAAEGGEPQRVSAAAAGGAGGFGDDSAPTGAMVAVRSHAGRWVVGSSLADARSLAGKVQGRRSPVGITWPIEVPPGDWHRVLQTTWVEPAYLEPDASWCLPGGTPASPRGNGGAFGGKRRSEVEAVARQLADEHGCPVRVLYTREDVVRFGPKRPPIAAGVRADGSGIVRVKRTPGIGERIRSVAPRLVVEEVDVVGPPTSIDLRGAGWVEAAVLLASLGDGPEFTVDAPGGGRASARIESDGTVAVVVRAGAMPDAGVARSYCIGAAHMALGWVRSEALTVDQRGQPADLTFRSFGILRAIDTPAIEVELVSDPEATEVQPVGDAVFAAVAAAAWAAEGWAPRWPTRR